MRGPRRRISATALLPRDWAGCFFISYAFFILIQYPVSRSYPTTWTFYGLLLPAAVMYAASYRRRLAELFAQPIVQAFLLLFVYVIFHALFFSPGYDGVAKTLLNTIDTVIFFLCSIAFFARVECKFLHAFFFIFSLLVLFCALFSIHLFYLHPNITGRLPPIGHTRNQTLGAYSYALAGIVSIYQYHRSASGMHKLHYLLVTLIVGVMILLTETRMAILVYALLVALMHGAYFKSIKPIAKLTLGGGMALAILAILFPALRQAAAQYVSEMLVRKDARRIELWSLTWQNIRQHPLVGYGMRSMLSIELDGYEHPISPHNIYLATLYYLGIPGMVLFLYPLWKSVKAATKLLLAGNKLGMLAAGLLAMGLLATCTDFGPLVKTPSPLWLIFWLPMAFVIGVTLREKSPAA